VRRLDRRAVSPPACLREYKHGRDAWGDLTKNAPHREELHARLEQLQGTRCAYCEGPLDTLGKHVEHFRPRGKCPHLTFDWANLFWSCYQDDSCGRFKDHGAGTYDPDDLLDPCSDDPDQFFRFRSNGEIELRKGLSKRDNRRAKETLRVFNLDPQHGRLRQMRARALKTYMGLEPDILAALEEFDPDERSVLILEELSRIHHEPFSTVIRHLFEEVGAP
jgi:uncharacterized protein (TIGR02646 family)